MSLRLLMFTHAASPEHDAWPFCFTLDDDEELRAQDMIRWSMWLAAWEPSRDWLQ